MNTTEHERYMRQMMLPGFGKEGQEKLRATKVLLVGVGGLGSACAFYLTAAGIGTIGLLDNDHVQLNNLHRQIVHSTNDLQKPKVISAKEKLSLLNSEVQFYLLHTRLSSDNGAENLSTYDIVVDCSDNFETKFLLNDLCVKLNKPLVHAGVREYEGQIMTILPRNTACVRCVFPKLPVPGAVPAPKDLGVLGTVPGLLGILQANEVINYCISREHLLVNTLLVCDLRFLQFRRVEVQRDKECLACGETTFFSATCTKERRYLSL